MVYNSKICETNLGENKIEVICKMSASECMHSQRICTRASAERKVHSLPTLEKSSGKFNTFEKRNLQL
jgi:hypothetical protein